MQLSPAEKTQLSLLPFLLSPSFPCYPRSLVPCSFPSWEPFPLNPVLCSPPLLKRLSSPFSVFSLLLSTCSSPLHSPHPQSLVVPCHLSLNHVKNHLPRQPQPLVDEPRDPLEQHKHRSLQPCPPVTIPQLLPARSPDLGRPPGVRGWRRSGRSKRGRGGRREGGWRRREDGEGSEGRRR